ncbi:MFS transporter [Steroidobacter sp. S1-65]|uniref:MFS transporter n=1 Tax=Steroidobacter gossypii TaxID=2805490 RepID=A0ABS1X2K8_9GAMM|nr:MFS transporter [Steroidobacter gossypii]MBM0107462.1 MFS transporter [Steroidobacter gossypii]
MSNDTTAAAPPRRSFAALRHPGYRGFFLAFAGAMMADSIEHVISYWIMFQKFQSNALGAFAVVSHWLPFLLLSLPVGALADHFDPRRLIQIGMVIFMGVSVAWGVLFLTDTLEIWHAMLLLTLHGIAGVLWTPSSQVLLHHVVPPEQLQSAVRLNATSRQLGLLGGPAIGGLLLMIFGPAHGILLNALIYVPTIVWLWKAPYSRAAAGQGAPRRALLSVSDVTSTLRRIASHPVLLSMILLSGGASFFIGNAYLPQMPDFARSLGHFDADLSYSVLLGADAVGALTAGFLLESRGWLQPNPRTAMILAIAWCGALAGFALSSIYSLAVLLLFIAGFMDLSFNSMSQTLVQLNAPADIRGRVLGVFSMMALGLRTFSGVTVGLMGAAIGIHSSLVLSALALVALSALLLVRSSRS